MKKIYLLLVVSILSVAVRAQTISATTYPFTNATGASLVDMSSGTTQIIGPGDDDPISSVYNIGFDFWLNGVRYSQFSANGNGLLRLGSNNITSAFTNNLATTTNHPNLAPYWDDLWVGDLGQVHYKVIGTAPSRVLVVEWQNMTVPRSSGMPGNATFQVWLTESTGKIDFVYGPGVVVTTNSYTVGFSTAATQMASITTTGPTVSYTTSNNTQTAAIADGTRYTFTPLIPAAPTGLSFTGVVTSAVTLNWTDASTDEVGFVIYRSTDGVNYTFVTQTAAAATSATVTGLNGSTLYYFRVYAVTEGGLSTPLEGSVTTAPCGVAGLKVVGPTGDYPTLQAAINDVQSNGASAPVTIELQTTYTGSGETFPVTIGAIPCAVTNPIVIRPQGVMTITATTATPIISMNGARYVTIDGRVGSTGTTKALTLINTNTSGQVFQFINDASDNTIRYCTIRGVNTSTTSGLVVFGTTTGTTGNDNNLIDNCDLLDGATTYVNGIYSSGTAGKENSNNTVSNNNIANFFLATAATTGINIAAGNTAWTINNNRFYQTASRTYTSTQTHRAVFVNTTAGNGFVVTNNIIGFSSAAGTGTYTMGGTVGTTFIGIALSVGNVTPSSVQGNTVRNIALTGSTGQFTGIAVTSGSANIGTLAANTIGASTGTGLITTSNSSTSNPGAVGIASSAASPAVVNIQNNVIGGITANGSSTTIGAGVFGIQASSSGSVTISGNTIGSTTTANSIAAGTAITGTAVQQVFGINSSITSSADVAPVITGNTIANLRGNGTSSGALVAGIIHSGSGSATISSNTVRDISGASANTLFTGQVGVTGIAYTGGTGSANITQNTIFNISNTNTASVQTHVAGIGYTASSNGTISRNRIYSLTNASTMTTLSTAASTTGILIGNPSGTNTTVVNNMISLGNGVTANNVLAGIMNVTTSSSTLRIYQNSVHIMGTVGSGALPSMAFHRGNFTTTAVTTPVDIKNNIFSNVRSGGTGKHYAIVNGINVTTASATGWGTNASNYNALNAAAATVGFWSTDQTFAGWRAASSGDLNSYSGIAITFTNPATADLHINMGVTPNSLESHGTLLAGFTTDFDNDTRPGPAGSVNGGAISPDLGADEFDGVGIDDVAPIITHTALLSTCSTGDRVLSAVIADQTGVPAAGSGNEPRIYFKKGISGTWYSAPGTLTSGTVTNGTWSFTIPSATLGGLTGADKVFYYIIAQDVMPTPNITANTAVGLAATSVNSVSAHPTNPNSYFINYTSGTFTVGAGQTFANLTDAIASYNSNTCITGNVTFSLTDATYSTGETFPLTINPNVLAGPSATLTIRPATGVTSVITGSSATAILVLNGADYVIIDGSNNPLANSVCPAVSSSRNLTITNTNTSTASAVVWLQSNGVDGATNNTVRNTNITGSGPAQTLVGIGSGGTGISVTSLGSENNDNTFENNNISNLQFGIYSSGNSATLKNVGTVINQNVINTAAPNNVSKEGIRVAFEDSITISGNNVANMSQTSSPDVFGIDAGFNGSIVVSTTTGREVTNATITHNVVRNINNSGTFSAVGIGVGPTPSGVTLIANNMISGVTANGTASDFAGGIVVAGGAGATNVLYNTVVQNGTITGGTAGSTISTAFAVTASTAPQLTLLNNIFVNTQTPNSGGSTEFVAIGFRPTDYSTLTSNHNAFYVSPGASRFMGAVGSLTAATFQNTLADWRAETDQDSASIEYLPVFTSSSDLHLQAVAANFPMVAGTPVTGVTNDIDCATRSTTIPVIGAHELAFPPCAGTPTAGTVNATVTSACGPFTSVLSIVGSSVSSGLTYQWQTSPDNTVWSDISGATSFGYTASVTTTLYYRAQIRCTASGIASETPGVQLVVNVIPDAITGPAAVCVGGTITLSSATGGGTWISSNTSVATIGNTSGVASGVSIGATTISYVITGTGCRTTRSLVVTSSPSVPVLTPSSSVICHNEAVAINAVATYSAIATFSSGTISVAVPDNSATGASTPLTVSLPAGAVITGASVNFNMSTTFVGDMNINLTAPNGKTMNLFNQHGSSGDNFVNTTVSSTGVTAFSSSAAPYTNTYAATRATGDIGAAGLPVNTTVWDSLYTIPSGTWRFSARDHSSSDVATITSVTLTLNYKVPTDITWSPSTGLYLDGAMTTAYAGENAATIFASPAAAGSTATVNTFTATASMTGCPVTTSANATVTVNPLPAAIGGSHDVCVGLSTSLTSATAGGTWSSSNTAAGTIDATTGVLTGIAAGTTTVSYTLTATGCRITQVITVNPLPAAITGTASVCEASTMTLSNADAGGTWSSSATTIATVDAATGVVTGVYSGFALITYSLPTSCIMTRQITVNAVPAVSITPDPVPAICIGNATTLSASATLHNFALMSQDFNSGLGAWTIDNISGNAASYFQIKPSPGYGGATGDGSSMLESASDAFPGPTSTMLISPSFSTVGYGSVALSFNEYLISIATADVTVAVEYSTDGGTVWIPMNDQVGAVVGSGAWTAGSPEVTVPFPAGAIGQPNVKLRWNYYSVQGLWWAIDNIRITAAQPDPTYTWAPVGAATGLSCTSCTTVSVTPGVTGVSEYEVTALTTAGCTGTATTAVTVNPLPVAIGGTLEVCVASTTTVTNADAGGTWSIATTGTASVDAATGEVTGISAGTTEVTYTLPTGCSITAVVTVHPLPAAIGGLLEVCPGLTTTLSNADAGGTWSADASGNATIDAAGVVTGVTAGTTQITYTLPTGCAVNAEVTVHPLPSAIGGSLQVCFGLQATVTNLTPGGSWSTSNAAVADIDAATGVVTGVTAGTATVTYTVGTGCYSTAEVTVNPLPAPITGSLQVCTGFTATLENADAGGTWSIAGSTFATVDPATGIVSGVNMGTTIVTYTLPTSCIITAELTVNPLPAPITGPSQLCEGAVGTFADGSAGGTWSVSTPGVATIDAVTGEANAVSSGINIVTYTLTSTGCIRTRTLTVNPLPAAVTGASEVCVGRTITLANATAGGTWSTSTPAVATVSGPGVVSGNGSGTTFISYTLATGCYSTALVTVNATPAAITGTFAACQGASTTLATATTGGTWVSGAPGIASVDAATGVVTGVSAGSAFISYVMPTGCARAATVVINTTPSTIGGPTTVCQSSTISLTNTVAGGAWTSSATAIAHVNTVSGLVTGLGAGTATITYTMLPGGCFATSTITVNELPAAITGILNVCNGQSTILSSATVGGVWSSGTAAVATVDAAGTVTGVSPGTAVISYSNAAGCARTVVVTVNQLPVVHAITGGGNFCSGTAGVILGLDGSQAGVSYQLYSAGSPVGASVMGTGTALSFAPTAVAGTFGVVGFAPATGCVNNMSGAAIITMTPSVSPTVTLSSGGSDSVCSGLPVTFTAAATETGSAPVYVWRVNGTVVPGATGTTYNYSPADSDIVSVSMTSSAACAIPATVTASRTMTVTSSVLPTVVAAAAPGSNVCEGTPVTFSATSLYGGTSPAYIWMKNGAVAGTGTSYTYTPANGDNVYVRMVSNYTCRLADTVSGSSIVMVVSPIYTPVVNITADPGTLVEQGTTVTLTASVTSGGPSPAFQWYLNGTAVSGATGATFVSSTFVNGDSVSCQVMGTGACGFAGFNSVVMSVVPLSVTPVNTISDVRLIPNPNKGEFTVKGTLATSSDKDVAIEIVNMLGQVVYKANTAARNGYVEARIKLENNLANGMYLLNLISGTDKQVFHFVLEQ